MNPLESGIGRRIAGYDLDANRILLPEHIRAMPSKQRKKWMDEHGIVPAVEGGAYSMFEMMQPFQQADGVAVTAAAETVLTQDTILTLPANFFSFVGKVAWFHVAGKESNVVTTPGTLTFRLRYNAIGGTILVASGAIIPDPVAVTDNLWTCDLYVKALAVGQLTTALTLLAYGRVDLANADASLASDKAKFLPAGGTSVANVTGLDGTVAKALTLTVTPTVATGSITVRDAWIVAMN
jgi:hypothetical protein